MGVVHFEVYEVSLDGLRSLSGCILTMARTSRNEAADPVPSPL